MKKSIRAGVVAAAGALSLAFAGSAFAAFTPRLIVTGGQTSNAGVTISAQVAATDDATARVTIYIPTGYQVGTPAAGAKLGTVDATAQAVDLGNTVLPLKGDLLAATSASQFAPQQAVCLGATPATQTWYLHLTAAGQTLDVPMFLVATTAAEQPLGTQKIVICLPPNDVPVGTPGRATFGAKLLTATFVNSAITNPASTGEYRWRSVWTPYAAGNGQPNIPGTVEAQSVVRLPTQITQKLTKKKVVRRVRGKAQVWWQVTVTGRVTENGAGVGGQRATITIGATKAKRVRVATGPTAANGSFKTTTLVRSPQWFQSSVQVSLRNLGAAGCVTTPSLGVPCASAFAGSYRLLSTFAKV